MHLLVVDDDLSLRESLKGWMGNKHTAVWRATGRGAVEALHHEPFDLMILDMVLEGVMTGWDVAFIKYSDPKLRKIPLIILTGVRTADVHIGAHVEREAIAAALLILQKPLDFVVLERALCILSEPSTA